MYGTFYWITFGVAGLLLFIIALALTAWSPIFAFILAIQVAFVIALAIAARRGGGAAQREEERRIVQHSGVLASEGRRAESEAGAASGRGPGPKGDPSGPGVGAT